MCHIARTGLSVRSLKLNHLAHRIPPLDAGLPASYYNFVAFFAGGCRFTWFDLKDREQAEICQHILRGFAQIEFRLPAPVFPRTRVVNTLRPGVDDFLTLVRLVRTYETRHAPHSTSGTTSTTRLKEKVKIKKQLPIDIAEEASVLRVSHIRVDFQRSHRQTMRQRCIRNRHS